MGIESAAWWQASQLYRESVSYESLAEHLLHEGNVVDYKDPLDTGLSIYHRLQLIREGLAERTADRDVMCGARYTDIEFEGREEFCRSTVFFRIEALLDKLEARQWQVADLQEAQEKADKVEAILDDLEAFVFDDESSAGANLRAYVLPPKKAFCDQMANVIEIGGAEFYFDHEDTGVPDVVVSPGRVEQLERQMRTDFELREVCPKSID